MSGDVQARLPFVILWIRATRAPFLQATFVPVILGSVIAWQVTHVFRWDLFLLTLVGASLIHIATNMFNDYFDFKSGNDLEVRHQNPFAGGGRILTGKLVKPSTHLLVATTSLVIGCLIGLYFVFALSLPYLLILGIIGVASSLFYVGPPFKLAYRGIGELVLGLNFGPVMTLGAFYVQTSRFMLEPLLASIPVGLLIVAVVWINEFPDMEADKAVGKKNLVLRLGYVRSIRVYVGMIFASYGLIIIYALLQLTTLASLIALLSIPFALKAVKILRTNYQDPHGIIPANANTIFLHLTFGALAIFGFLLGAFVNI
jgi:1,4-dihydroxy-2-naphthoate octaprenyltransferase